MSLPAQTARRLLRSKPVSSPKSEPIPNAAIRLPQAVRAQAPVGPRYETDQPVEGAAESLLSANPAQNLPQAGNRCRVVGDNIDSQKSLQRWPLWEGESRR